MDGCVEEIYIEMYVNSVYTERPHTGQNLNTCSKVSVVVQCCSDLSNSFLFSSLIIHINTKTTP